MIEVDTKQLDDLAASPTLHYESPHDVPKDRSLTKSEKLAVLVAWDQDAESLDRAADEGMSPAPTEASIRPDIEGARESVTKTARKNAM